MIVYITLAVLAVPTLLVLAGLAATRICVIAFREENDPNVLARRVGR